MTGAMELENPDAGQNGAQVVAVLQNRSAEDIELLKQMRTRVAVLDPESTDIDDASLHRFLRARSRDVKRASKMFAEHQKWRREYLPLGHAQEEEIRDDLEAEKYFMQGLDRSGRPIAVVLPAKHFGSRNVEPFKRSITYMLDKLVASLPAGEEKFVIMCDLKGLKFKNLDPRGWIAGCNFLQAYYPERLGRAFLLHTPSIFWGAWKLVVPFLDPVTKEKLVFVDDDKVVETLCRDISKEDIPTMFGGSKEMIPIELAQPANWPQFKPAS